MLCPFCLAQVKFKLEPVQDRPAPIHQCPACKEQVPALYVQGYRNYPPVVVSAVGFRQHGKTVYLSTLFYALKELDLPTHWPTFFTAGLNEDSLTTIYENVNLLKQGSLPDSTPKNFPRPIMMRVHGVPFQPNCTLLCYDTGGECFERATQLVQFAGFVRRARTAMLLVSIPNLEDPSGEMLKLLNTYVIGMGDLGARTQDQHLVVVYTKADEVIGRLGEWRDLGTYLTQGSVDGLAQPRGYVQRMHRVSGRLREFTQTGLKAGEFLNTADTNFASVTLSIVSALGAKSHGNQLSAGVVPRRVLDPLLWMMEKSLPSWKQSWRRWRG